MVRLLCTTNFKHGLTPHLILDLALQENYIGADCRSKLLLSLRFLYSTIDLRCGFVVTEVRGAASNSAYYDYPELWIQRYPAHRYHAVPWPGFKPMTLWLRVRRPNHSATMWLIYIMRGFQPFLFGLNAVYYLRKVRPTLRR
jgi:hypothetical protein